MPTVAGSVAELLGLLQGLVRVEGDQLVVLDEAGLRSSGVRDLAWTAAFSADQATIDAARWIVWEASQALGVRSASIHDLYMARAAGEVHGFTVPAINIRAQTFDMARVIFETARRDEVSAVICELARSEQTYTYQRPAEYATSVLAGAMAAGWRGPVFIQGDHYQFNAVKYAADPEAMTAEIRKACVDAIAAGYRNIDIDSSTLVDLVQADDRRSAARELPPGSGAHGPHPGAAAGERDHQRRRRDRRSRQEELHRRGAGRLPRGVIAESLDRSAARPSSACPRSASRPAPPTAVSRCPTAASRRSSWTSRSCESSARRRAATTSRAASSTVRAPSPTSCSTASRRSRRRRSTSRRASRTRSSTIPRSRRTCGGRSSSGARRRRPTSARPTRPRSSS